MPLLKIMHITPIWPQSYWRPFGIYFHYFIQIFHVTSMDYNAPWALVNPSGKGSIGAKIRNHLVSIPILLPKERAL